MSTELLEQARGTLIERATLAGVSTQELELVKRTVAQGATDAELKLFLFDCQRRGVHPLDKLLHFTKRGGKYTPVTSIDFMRSQAAASGEMAGSDDARFVQRGDVPYPEDAFVTVYRLTQGQRFGYSATARWSEYYPGDAGGAMWRKMPHTMLGKCAEALALRKAFPQQLAGLYSREEMDQAESPASGSIAAPAAPETLLDTSTGEEVPASSKPKPPDGYGYVNSYDFSNGWHDAVIDVPLKGQLRLSTKKAIGALANEAYRAGLPVKVSWSEKKPPKSGEGYLNSISLWKQTRETPDDVPPFLDSDVPF